MPDMRCNVLFRCTGHLARSIMAECLANRLGEGRIRAWSAGSHPRGEVHPFPLEILRRYGFHTTGLRRRSWEEFAGPDGPRFDAIITVCDQAAGEDCPVWRGHPVQAHWSIEDPAAAEGERYERHWAVECAYRNLEAKVKEFARILFSSFDPQSLRSCMVRLVSTDATSAAEPE